MGATTAGGADAGDALPVVDAHQHFWDARGGRYPWLGDRPPARFRYGALDRLPRLYLPADYRRDAAGWGGAAAGLRVVATVHVEAEWDPAEPAGETRWLAGLAAREGLPTVLVAQAWLDRDDADEVLAAQAACPLVRGIRQKPAAAASAGEARRGAPGSMDDPRFRRGYARLERHRLSYDLQTPWWHLDAAAELARDFPATPLILNHAGLPADRSEEGLAGWRRAMATLAAQPNAAVKISGLGRPGVPWTAEGNRRVVRETIEIFGVDRCLLASNWPVDGLVADRLETVWAGLAAIVADRPAAERRRLFHDNAARVYRL